MGPGNFPRLFHSEAFSMEQLKSKITPKDLGNAKKGAALDKGKKHVLGVVVGVATGIFTKPQPNGDVSYALKGSFVTRPADTENFEPLRSAVCYLPSGIQEAISTKFEGENPASQVQFALELATRPAENKAGYEWVATPLTAIEESNPTDALIEQLKDKLPALPKPAAKSAGTKA